MNNFFCIDCQHWFEDEDEGQWVRNTDEQGNDTGLIWICDDCIMGDDDE